MFSACTIFAIAKIIMINYGFRCNNNFANSPCAFNLRNHLIIFDKNMSTVDCCCLYFTTGRIITDTWAKILHILHKKTIILKFLHGYTSVLLHCSFISCGLNFELYQFEEFCLLIVLHTEPLKIPIRPEEFISNYD